MPTISERRRVTAITTITSHFIKFDCLAISNGLVLIPAGIVKLQLILFMSQDYLEVQGDIAFRLAAYVLQVKVFFL